MITFLARCYVLLLGGSCVFSRYPNIRRFVCTVSDWSLYVREVHSQFAREKGRVWNRARCFWYERKCTIDRSIGGHGYVYEHKSRTSLLLSKAMVLLAFRDSVTEMTMKEMSSAV